MLTWNCYKSYHKLYTSGRRMRLFLARCRSSANTHAAESASLLHAEQVEERLHGDAHDGHRTRFKGHSTTRRRRPDDHQTTETRRRLLFPQVSQQLSLVFNDRAIDENGTVHTDVNKRNSHSFFFFPLPVWTLNTSNMIHAEINDLFFFFFFSGAAEQKRASSYSCARALTVHSLFLFAMLVSY